MRHQFATLIEGAVEKCDDALVGPRSAFAKLDDLGFDPERVSVKNRLREAHFIPAEIRDGGPKSRIAHRDADHQAQREDAVYEPLPELGFRAAIFLVEVQAGRVVRQCAEQQIVRLGDCAMYRVVEHLPHYQLIEIQPRHLVLLPFDQT